MDINLRKEVEDLFMAKYKARIRVENGIMTVVLPNGEVWDMTVPQRTACPHCDGTGFQKVK